MLCLLGALFIVTDKDSTYQEGSRNVLMKGNIFSANSASEAGGLLLVDTTQGIQVACSRSYPIWKSLDELYQSSFCPGWRPSIGNSDMAERVNKNNIEHIAYGEMFASVSVGMLKVDPQSIKTLSGVSLERFVVTPMDLFGQEMTTDVLLTSIEAGFFILLGLFPIHALISLTWACSVADTAYITPQF